MTVMDAFVDVGKSGIRLQVVSDRVTRTRTAEGISPTQPGDHGSILGKRIGKLLIDSAATSANRVLIGSTSELFGNELPSLFFELQQIVPDTVIAVTDDGTLAHARFLNAPGVVLAVGTGVIAIARSTSAGILRFDGWGPLAGDRGSAVEVGRAALKAAYRAVDEDRKSPLRVRVEQHLGTVDLAKAREILLDAQWPATLAGLATSICNLADSRNVEAADILDLAAAELVHTTRIAVAAAGVADIVVTGRFGTANALRSRLQDRFLKEGFRLVPELPPGSVSADEIMSGPYGSSMTFASRDNRNTDEGGS